MAKHLYSLQIEGNSAKAVGRDLPISFKHSSQVCKWIKQKNLQKAKEMLKRVIALKQPVPYSSFLWDLGHKPGIGPGRYPVKTCQELLKLLESVEKNAQFRGLNTSKLVIAHMNAHKAATPWRNARHRGRKMKRAHVEIIVQESQMEAKKEQKVKPAKKMQKSEAR